MKLITRSRTIPFPRRALIMGIVNLGADSFCGDGLVETHAALERARRLIAEGADIIDIGAESAGTGRTAISEQEETDRLCAFVEDWNETALLSINTWRPAVAQAVLELGGDILNDIGALPNDENARTSARHGVALVIMHSVGAPKIKHTHVRYEDVMSAIESFFGEKIALAENAGLSRDAIILDPGIDFAKQRPDNLRVFRELETLHAFGRPILLPVSRKTVIGEVLGINDPLARDAGTVACTVAGLLRRAHIFRVHNARGAAQAARIVEAIAAGQPSSVSA